MMATVAPITTVIVVLFTESKVIGEDVAAGVAVAATTLAWL
jgi:hypothetical protein